MAFAKLNLSKSFFNAQEKVILEAGSLSASVFQFPSGVCGLRVKNAKGELVILPFQGQQVWSASFCGRSLAMKSTFSQPFPTTDFLNTYGGFLLHCGATAMGNPSAEDSHPLHGELPNMPYDDAYIAIGEDALGCYLAVGGKAHYTVAFAANYTAEPEIKLYENATVFDLSMKITNLRIQPMDYMYLCHINFRPIDGSRLVYSAPADKEHIKVHFDIPEDMAQPARDELKTYMTRVAENPQLHNTVEPSSQVYNPEIVFSILYKADSEGFAHSMQVMPEGDACYVAFKPAQLPVGVRWIARTGDEDAMGLVLPATGDHKGYTAAKRNGMLKTIDGGGSVTMTVKIGYLDRAGADSMAANIKAILQ
jgi:hypothetical protein